MWVFEKANYQTSELEWLILFTDFCDESMLKGMKADGEDPAERLDVKPSPDRFQPYYSHVNQY